MGTKQPDFLTQATRLFFAERFQNSIPLLVMCLVLPKYSLMHIAELPNITNAACDQEKITLGNHQFIERIARLYEQEPPDRRYKRLGQYVLKWVRWVRSGLSLLLDKKSKTEQKPRHLCGCKHKNKGGVFNPPCLFFLLLKSVRI